MSGPLLPGCRLQPMLYVEEDECVTHNRLPWECRDEMAEAIATERARMRVSVAALPQPTLGLAGGVNRAAVLAALGEQP